MQLLRGRTTRVDRLAFSPDGRHLAAGGNACAVYDFSAGAWAALAGISGLHAPSLYFLSPTALVLNDTASWRRFDHIEAEGTRALTPWGLLARRDWPASMAAQWAAELPPWVRSADTLSEVVQELTKPDPTPALRGLLLKHGMGLPGEPAYRLPRGRGSLDPRGPGWRVHFSPDGRRLYAGGHGQLHAFDGTPGAAGGAPLADVALGHKGAPRSLSVHPAGRLLALAESEAVTFRDAQTLDVVRTYDFAMPKLTAVAFSPDGLRCAVGNSKGKVLLFDVDE